MTTIGQMKGVVTADTKSFEDGMKRASDAHAKTTDVIKKGSAQTAQVIQKDGRRITLHGRTVQSALNKQNRAYASAVRAIDPARAALDSYMRRVTAIRNANRLGITTQAQMTREIQLAKTAYYSAAAGAASFNAASTRGMGSTRSMGNAIQQAGYQVGDFAVQVASGQGVLRPLIQQGTQLVSMFGPMGAVIGAAGATLGALATAFLTSGDAAEEAVSSYSLLQDAITDLNKEAENNINVNGRQVKSFLDVARAANIQTRAALSGYMSSLTRAQDELVRLKEAQEDALNNPSGDAGAVVGQMAFFARAISTAEDKISDLQSKVDELGGTLDTVGEDIASFGERVNKSVFDQIDATNQLVAALRISQHEYDVTKTAASLLVQEGFEGGPEAARAFAETLVMLSDEMDRIKQANTDAKAAQEYIQQITDQIAANDNLIDALRISDYEYKVVGKTLTILGSNFRGTEQEARAFAETIIAQEDAINRLRRASETLTEATTRGNAIRESVRTNAEKLAIEEARLNKLRQMGVIDQETLNDAMDKAREKYQDQATVAARVGEILSKSTETWIDKLVDGTFKAKDAVKLLLGEMLKLATSQAFLALIGRDGSKLGKSSSLFGSALSSSVGGLLGFQNGGEFEVGGQGGVDSQLVAFKASPNETVSVSKPGQKSGGATFNMDFRGAEIGVEQRVRMVVREMLPDIAGYTTENMASLQRRNKLGGGFG